MALFKHPYKTTIPFELGEDWEDQSWVNEASASCWLSVPTAKNPRAVLVLWVQPDEKSEREFPNKGKFQLDFMPDSDEGWTDECKTLVSTHDIGRVRMEIKKYTQRGVK